MKKCVLMIGVILAVTILLASCASARPSEVSVSDNLDVSSETSKLSIDIASLDGTLWVFETTFNENPFFHCISIAGDSADFYVRMDKETDGHEKHIITIEGNRIKFTNKRGGANSGTFNGDTLVLNNEKSFLKQY